MRSCYIIILSVFSLTFLGCAEAGKKTATGAAIGAGAGALAGAIIGHQTGKRGKGAAIGAVLGAGIGSAYGYKLDKQAKELQEIAETKRTENGIVTKLKGDILFDSGKTELKPDAQAAITKISDIIKKYPEDVITIVGHTDSQGSDASNQQLSQARAGVVKALMVQKGVPANTISTVGAGENTPVASNNSKTGRAQNRRVELQISIDESKIKE